MSSVFDSLRLITNGGSLSIAQARAAMGEIMDGDASALQVAALLGALRMRGESIPEITGFALAMRERMVRVQARSRPLVDTCGTGGDASVHAISTFNISTSASFIAAGAGAMVAKHGNRAVSSRSGSSDVLEALGVKLSLSPEQIARCIDEVGVGFMFAPSHHPAMKHAAPIRRELGIRTVFNLLGPLCNPASAQRQVLGVSDERWIEPIAQVLGELGVERAIVCHSRDGMDEFSTMAPTDYILLDGGSATRHTLDPRELGIAGADAQVLAGGEASENARLIERLLQNSEGAAGDIACLNASAILVVSGQAQDFEQGLKLARESVRSGAAHQKLARLVELSNGL